MIFFLNFVFPGLFGHNLGPLKKKKNENIFFGRLGKSTSIRAIDLAVQLTHFSWSQILFEIFAQCKNLTFHNSGTQKYPKYKDHVHVRRLADMEATREFLQNSTIHGLHHIASAEVNIL